MPEREALFHCMKMKRVDALFIFLTAIGFLTVWKLSHDYQNYQIFHALAELASIMIYFMVFGIAWNTRSLGGMPFSLVLGVGMLGTGILDLAHTLSYKGMGIFPLDGDPNMSTQFWMAARILESSAFLLAVLVLQRKKPLNAWYILLLGLTVTLALLGAIYPLGLFPDAMLATSGLTPFKIVGEYVIAAVYLLCTIHLFRARSRFDARVLALLLTALCLKTVSEITFTLYGLDVYGTFNAIGHVLKATSAIALYMALVHASLATPYRTLFRELENSRQDLSRELQIRQQAEAALTESEAKLRTSFANAPIGFAITDPESHILEANPAYCRLTGYGIGELRNLDFDRLVHPDDYDENKRLVRQMLAGEMPDFVIENRYVRKDGQAIWVRKSVSAVRDANGTMSWIIALVEDITTKRQSDELIWQHANFDALTGLPNRRFFQERLEHEIRLSRRSDLPLALMFLDLDGFKDVNDTLGHDAGDLLLKETAERLQNCVRDTDTVARLGGDEFTVILTGQHSPGSVNRVADHILKELAEPFRLEQETAHVTASIGITLYPGDATDIEDLLKNADQAMYAAKQHGKNQFRYFTGNLQQAASRRMPLK